MKADIIGILIAILFGALIGWGFSSMAQLPEDLWVIGIVVGLEMALLGVGLFGIKFEDYPRSGVMVRAACAFGLIVLAILNTIYAFVGVNSFFYVLNGIIALLILLATKVVYASKQ